MAADQKASGLKGRVFCEVTGGLGNQIFNVLAALAYADRTGRDCYFRRSLGSGHRPSYWHNLWLQLPQIADNRWEKAIAGSHHFVDHAQGHRPIPDLKEHKDVQLSGYFQSAKYFDMRKLRDKLFPAELARFAKEMLEDLPDGGAANLAFMHFRRGDYKGLQFCHNLLPVSFYERAAELFPPQVRFIVLCENEDLASIRREVGGSPILSKRKVVFADNRLPDYIQLLMMAACPAGGIVANSSFSAIAAYLHPPGNRIVCPKKWFAQSHDAAAADIPLPHWTKLDN